MYEITFSDKKFRDKLTLIEKSNVEFAARRTLTQFAKDFKSDYIKDEFSNTFRSAVPFTLNSTFTVQRGLELDVGVKNVMSRRGGSGKGNPAGFYLYPTIGGGSNVVYETLFPQHLVRSGYMNKGDFPYPNVYAADKFGFFRLKNGRPTANTAANTIRGLAKTRGHKGRFPVKMGKIQDARVISFKEDKVVKKKDGTTKVFKKGIYREVASGRGKKRQTGLFMLFAYDAINTVKPKPLTFAGMVHKISEEHFMDMWVKEIKRLAKY